LCLIFFATNFLFLLLLASIIYFSLLRYSTSKIHFNLIGYLAPLIINFLKITKCEQIECYSLAFWYWFSMIFIVLIQNELLNLLKLTLLSNPEKMFQLKNAASICLNITKLSNPVINKTRILQ
jgi:hypothetical protein